MAIPLWSTLPPLLALLTLGIYRVSTSHHLPLPPGPKPKFFTGNLHQLPPLDKSWLVYAKWSEIYGSPLVFFRIMRRKFIVLNTLQAAMDLLDGRANVSSNRPQSYAITELADRKLSVFAITAQHPRFKAYRKLLQSGLGTRATASYRHVYEDEARTLLKGLANASDEFISHARRYTGAIVLKIAYGWTVTANDDYFVALMKESFQLISSVSRPGRFLVDTFHFLRFVPSWFPFVTFHRELAEYKAQISRIDQIPHNWVKEQIRAGNYEDSFTSQNLLPGPGETVDAEQDDIIKWCSSAIYAGGAETTSAVLTAFFLAMTLYPDSQARAQAEIAEVVGSSRLPNFDDQENLPYVSALIKELLRWAPPSTLGMPHQFTEDQTYEGYFIPKGTAVLYNIWSLGHNAEVYPDPDEFRPERFCPSEGMAPQLDPRRFVFGFGKRICPGAHFAEVSVFVAISNILAAFNISKARDKDGREITPEIAFVTAQITHIKPFDCRITPRVPSLLEDN